MLSFGQAVRAFYGRYVDFQGRSQRSEYWWVQLYVTICYIVFGILIFMGVGGLEGVNALFSEDNYDQVGPVAYVAIFGIFIFFLANMIPNIAIQVRRFHDLGQTGWYVLAFIVGGQIPIIGIFAYIGNVVWFALQGTSGPNKYGPDPLYSQSDVFE